MSQIGFSAEKYIEEQSKYILERIDNGDGKDFIWSLAESWFRISML